MSFPSFTINQNAIKTLLPSLLCALLALSVLGFSHWVSANELDPNTVEQYIETVNINQADAETLAAVLKGVGIKRAGLIVEWRETNGAFVALEQLLEIKGIGARTLEKNRNKIQL